MPFANLTQRDKDAFFALLDEYFESRPHLFQNTVNAGAATSMTNGTAVAKPAPSVVNTPPRTPARALSTSSNTSQQATSTPPIPKPRSSGPPAVPARTATPRIVEPAPEEHEARDNDNDSIDSAPVSVSSRIAAAQAAFGNSLGPGNGRPPVPSQRRFSSASNASNTSQAKAASPPPTQTHFHTPPTTTSSSPPPPPARANSGANAPSTPNGSANGLVSSRGMGSIDTSSAGAAVSTVFSFKGMGKNEKKPTGVHVQQKSAFERPKTKDTYAPPPSRSTPKVEEPPVTMQGDDDGEYAKGEWVEALYDFDSSDATDLPFKAGQQVFVTERTSKDWWMAQSGDKEGLIPAAYVKVL
ncbi:SubName: Full=Uncharacterized protein {ECO:0000313/EMBL:CCA66985.1} [Serendipita indica DSM 11827]|nr:SubName: Full=Uncharacterized protein {ECO:0000313/EMBL:CCA66985.1} [Serendipita indica DSM 11827]